MLRELRKFMSFRLFLATTCISICSSIATISLMGLSGWLIASAALLTPLYLLSLAIVSVRVCGILRPLFRYGDRLFTHKLAFTMFATWRTHLVSKIVHDLPLNISGTTGYTYEIIVNAIDRIRDAWIRFYIHPFSMTGMALILAIFFYAYADLASLLIIMGYLVLVLAYPYLAQNLYARLVVNPLKLNQEIFDIYDGNTELLVYGYSEDKLIQVRNAIEIYQHERMRRSRLQAKLAMGSDILFGILIIIAISIFIFLVNTEIISGVTAIMMFLIVQASYEIMATTVDIISYYDDACNQWEELQQYIKPVISPNRYVAGANNLQEHQLVDVVNVAYGYQNKILVEVLSFSLQANRRTLVLGASGTGKSTLFNLLSKIMDPLAGDIYFRGKNYATLDPEVVRSQLAVCFQDQHIFERTVRENFQMIHPNISDEEIILILERFQLADVFAKQGLDTVLSNNASNLSGGQRHRLQMAISLARPRDIILLDEPTAGLDMETAHHLLNELADIFADAAVLVSTHDLSLIDYFDEVIILGDKTMLEKGDINILRQNPQSYLYKLLQNRNFSI